MLVSRELSGGYLDELYYIEFGLKYVRCVLPAYFNPEHPPLGKYLIGALSVLNPRVVPALFGVLATIVLAISIQKLRGSSLIAALAVAVLASEVSFVKTFNYALLDSIAVGFASVATYFSIFYSKPA
ncbi:MAG: phospholipid carrier-dependent glycosyltransferase, partial [Sulfolobales archaeon]